MVVVNDAVAPGAARDAIAPAFGLRRPLRPVLPGIRSGTLRASATPAVDLPFPLGRPATQLWYLGRNAIHAAVGILGLPAGSAVAVPAYTNGVEVAALVARGLRPVTVRNGPGLALDVDDLDRVLARTRAKLVLAIHYLGFPQPIDAVAAVCRTHGAILFEDCALSFLARLPDGRPVGSVGALAVFSLYKTLPIPDGAALAINDPTIATPDRPVEPDLSSSASGVGRLLLRGAQSGDVAGRVAAGLLDAARRAASIGFRASGVERTAAGSMTFESKRLPWGASAFARAILPRLDYGRIVAARRRNFLRLRDRLSGLPTLFDSLPDGACPLFYPVIVEEKDRFRRKLAERSIETVDFWSTWHPATPPDPEIARLRRSVVELPCLQDLSPEAIDEVADAVLDVW